jgi:hypothetical protein
MHGSERGGGKRGRDDRARRLLYKTRLLRAARRAETHVRRRWTFEISPEGGMA